MTAVAPASEELLACPLCEYELRDPARRLHPYLFEHHRERNIWSFRKTLLGSIRPRRFWGTLFPTQPSFPRRLLIYALLVAALAATPLLLASAYRLYQVDQQI